MAGSTGGLAQLAWSSLSTVASPAFFTNGVVRRCKGQETNKSLLERLGWPSERKPGGPLFWFHAQSVGEAAVILPVIHRCLLEYEKINILLTTCTSEAYSLLSRALPSRVILQYAAWDLPAGILAAILHWRPQVVIFVESDLPPNLIEIAGLYGAHLALLNARLPPETCFKWHSWRWTGRRLMNRMMSRFSLIVPQSDIDVGRFRMLGASISQMPGWCADLKYAAAMGACVWEMWRPTASRVMEIKKGVVGRPLWIAASTHEGEEEIIGRVHLALSKEFHHLVTVIVPRHHGRCQEAAEKLLGMGLSVRLWSHQPRSYSAVDVFVVDVVGELPLLYAVSEIAFVGGSLLQGQNGHNLAEAAVAGCAVVVGKHAGHFNRMADELNQAAVAAAEEAAAVVNNSGIGGIYDDYMEEGSQDGGPDTSHRGNGGLDSPPSSFSRFINDFSQLNQPQRAHRPHNRALTVDNASRPATAPAVVAHQWEFEPWPITQRRGGGNIGGMGDRVGNLAASSPRATPPPSANRRRNSESQRRDSRVQPSPNEPYTSEASTMANNSTITTDHTQNSGAFMSPRMVSRSNLGLGSEREGVAGNGDSNLELNLSLSLNLMGEAGGPNGPERSGEGLWLPSQVTGGGSFSSLRIGRRRGEASANDGSTTGLPIIGNNTPPSVSYDSRPSTSTDATQIVTTCGNVDPGPSMSPSTTQMTSGECEGQVFWTPNTTPFGLYKDNSFSLSIPNSRTDTNAEAELGSEAGGGPTMTSGHPISPFDALNGDQRDVGESSHACPSPRELCHSLDLAIKQALDEGASDTNTHGRLEHTQGKCPMDGNTTTSHNNNAMVLGENDASTCPSPYPSDPSRPCSVVSTEQLPPFSHLHHPTPTSGNSPGMSPRSYGDTPMWAQTTPMSMGPTVDGAPTRAPWRAPSHAMSPTIAQSGIALLETPTGSPLAGHSRLGSGTTEFDLYSGLSLRYQGEYILPATHLPYAPHGPAVWRVSGEQALAEAIGTLLREPLERRSRGHAAAQAAAKLATGLVSTVWSVLDDMVLEPALKQYEKEQGTDWRI